MKTIYALTIAFSFLIGIYFYPQMPSNMISHWSASGVPNGNLPKFWGLFLVPLITLVLTLLLYNIPKIDPMKNNLKKFIKYYNYFILDFIIFMTLIQILVILWNKGILLNFNIAFPLIMGIFFFHLGVLLTKTERNWFIGIRTPWTISNDYVWKKTHALGGKLFKISGAISVAGIFFGKYSFWFIIIPILASSIISFAYSYIIYKNVNQKR